MIRLAFLLSLSIASHPVLAFPTYASGDGFRGAQLMTPEERTAHVARMQSMRTYAECQAYMQAHEDRMQARARERNVILPPKGGDPCSVMRAFGRIR